MLNRRQFVYSAMASVVAFAHRATVFATDYDLIIKGGRVIDPSLHVNALRDVAVIGNRIASVAANIDVGDADVIDATGKLVVPGLLDVHCHYARDDDGPRIGLSDGVTEWVDAGSAGADQIDEMVAIARSAPQPAACLNQHRPPGHPARR